MHHSNKQHEEPHYTLGMEHLFHEVISHLPIDEAGIRKLRDFMRVELFVTLQLLASDTDACLPEPPTDRKPPSEGILVCTIAGALLSVIRDKFPEYDSSLRDVTDK